MAQHTVAAELVYQLAEYGVKQVFGITGDAMNAFTDALRKDGKESYGFGPIKKTLLNFWILDISVVTGPINIKL